MDAAVAFDLASRHALGGGSYVFKQDYPAYLKSHLPDPFFSLFFPPFLHTEPGRDETCYLPRASGIREPKRICRSIKELMVVVPRLDVDTPDKTLASNWKLFTLFSSDYCSKAPQISVGRT